MIEGRYVLGAGYLHPYHMKTIEFYRKLGSMSCGYEKPKSLDRARAKGPSSGPILIFEQKRVNLGRLTSLALRRGGPQQATDLQSGHRVPCPTYKDASLIENLSS